MKALPRPVTLDQEFMAGICARLDHLAGLLEEHLPGQAGPAETPPPSADDAPAAVGLREPDRPVTPDPGSDAKAQQRRRATKSTKGTR